MTSITTAAAVRWSDWLTPGLLVLFLAAFGAAVFFVDGLDALLTAWSLPEYSHGPIIPILSGLLFLRQLKSYPVDPGPKRDRWAGVAVILAAIALASLGKLSNISDLVAYAEKRGLMYVIDEPSERQPVPKAYADNFRYRRLFPWTH